MAHDLARIRNIGIVAHIDAGKTTTTERILYYTGREHRLGNVDEASTVTDWMREEQERGITITSAAVTVTWRDHTINIIDTPGHVDFTAEVERALRVLDGAVGVFDARHGVQAQSETVWRQAKRYNVPRIAYINKMDVIGADFTRALASLETKLHARALPLQYPRYVGDVFEGVVDLVGEHYLTFGGELGTQVDAHEIPDDVADDAALARIHLLEMLSDFSDEVAERYLSDGSLSVELLRRELRRGTIAQAFTPVLCGSSFKNRGVQPLMDAIVQYLPAPHEVAVNATAAIGEIGGEHPKKGTTLKRKIALDEPFTALAFKTYAFQHGDLTYLRVYAGSAKRATQVTNARSGRKERLSQMFRMHGKQREPLDIVRAGDIIACTGLQDTVTGDTLCAVGGPILLEGLRFPHTVVEMAIEGKTAGDRDKLAEVLKRLAREDPTFKVKEDARTGQTLIAGMGELHLEVLTGRMLNEFHAAANVGKPSVAYMEAPHGSAQATGEIDRELPSGAALFARVTCRVEPSPETAGVVVENAAPKDAIPRQHVGAVERALCDAVASGGHAGFPVIQAKVTLLGGESREAASPEAAFLAAAAAAARQAMETAGTDVLEPIMRLAVETPHEYVGVIQRDLHARRAEIEDIETEDETTIIRGRVPIAEMFGYATAIRTLSSGRAAHTLEPLTFARVPPDVQARFTY